MEFPTDNEAQSKPMLLFFQQKFSGIEIQICKLDTILFHLVSFFFPDIVGSFDSVDVSSKIVQKLFMSTKTIGYSRLAPCI